MPSIKKLSISAVVQFSIILGTLLVATSAQAGSPFKTLLGTWGGNGIFELKSGAKERITCNAYYTGGESQLGMNIRCSSDNQKIEMRSKLSLADGTITGKWEERTFNAEGDIKGKADNKKIKLTISGAVSGSMDVTFSRVSQQVEINTTGTDLKIVNITLTRR